MRSILTFIIVFCFISLQTSAQFSDDFSDSDLSSNPTWLGDLSEFEVNAAEELQLQAPDAGNSLLYSQLSFPDSLRWSMQMLMDFAPSASNRLRIYLYLSDIDVSIASGYFIEMGENGSEDAINFYRLDQGNEELMASGTMGAMGTDPAFAEWTIEKSADDLWSLYASYVENDFKELEFDFQESNSLMGADGFFGIECIYTVSRAEDYFFDDIVIEELLPDVEKPAFISAELIADNEILLVFSEAVDLASLSELSNYLLSPLGMPDNVIADLSNPNQAVISFPNPLESGIIYLLEVSGVKDLAGNEMTAVSDIEIIKTEMPGKDDLILTEILFDPYQDGEDFVEIYNRSDKFINLNGIILSNDSKSNDTETISSDMLLKPGEYLAISPDVQHIMDTYLPPTEAKFLNHDIPSFNNDSGNVSIDIIDSNGSKISIDSFDYVEDMHYILLDDTEGVSLERVSFDLDTNDPKNWFSAVSKVNYATPGYENSQSLGTIAPSEETLSLTHKTFSPNQDGDNDFLVIQYVLDKPGYLANLRIFDANGFSVRSLSSNELLSTEGIILWDGLKDDNSEAPIGMYIIQYNIFHPEGDIKEGKVVAVLADFL